MLAHGLSRMTEDTFFSKDKNYIRSLKAGTEKIWIKQMYKKQ